MSWRASGWAKGTRGHKGLASKSVLLILGEYHDDERGYAWPSQKRIADDLEITVRTVRSALSWLERSKLITVLQKGNQFQPTQYRLNFDISDTRIHAGEIRGQEKVSPAPEGEVSGIEHGQPTSLEAEILANTSLQEPSIEPSEYINILRGIEGWSARGEPHMRTLLLWKNRNGISDEQMERSATGLAASLSVKKYPNLSAALQVRVNKGYDENGSREGNSNGKTRGRTPPTDDPTAKFRRQNAKQ